MGGIKSGKKEKNEKKKKRDGESRTNKCTVAALLSQFNRPDGAKATSTSPTSGDISTSPLTTLSESPTPLQQQQEQSRDPLHEDAISGAKAKPQSMMKLIARKKSSSLSAAASRKNANKLRDYFGPTKDDDKSTMTSVTGSFLEQNSPNEAIARIDLLKKHQQDQQDESEMSSQQQKQQPSVSFKIPKATAKKRKGLAAAAGIYGADASSTLIEREISVATKKLKASLESSINRAAAAAAAAADSSSLFNVDYSSQSQLVFEITSDDGLRVISYDINRKRRLNIYIF